MERISLPKSETAIFSWDMDSLSDLDVLSELSGRAVFQEVPAGREPAVLDALADYEVYLLTGSPTMGAAEMKEAVRRSKQGFRGSVFDVEPYGQAAWAAAENRTAILDGFCAQAEEVYAYAGEQGVEMLLCIPFWYDELGYDSQLEKLVCCCDGICVMNYSRGHEMANIRREHALAGRYYKKMWTIYELAPSDGRTVMDINTYYEQGLAAVKANYQRWFSKTDIALAYHDLASVRKVRERTGK